MRKEEAGRMGGRGYLDGQNGSMDGMLWADFGTGFLGCGRQVEKSPSVAAPEKLKT